ncbi:MULTISPECIES: phage tail protein [Flavobacteriaceae]|nr:MULTISPECIES: tail fiber protein [Flavobacteriaceae]GGK37523.1 tail Collar domain-containing protein [Lutibacter litoralis]
MEPFLGQITMFGGNFAPRGWAYCNGQLLAISQNTALFSILGTTYGGDGRTTFALPDLRGRAPINSGGGSAGPGLSPRPLGQRGGAQDVTLNQTQMPNHNHASQIAVNSSTGGESNPSGQFIAAHSGAFSEESSSGSNLNGLTIGAAGGNLSHPNMQPYLAVNFIIALVGIFPSRN